VYLCNFVHMLLAPVRSEYLP